MGEKEPVDKKKLSIRLERKEEGARTKDRGWGP